MISSLSLSPLRLNGVYQSLISRNKFTYHTLPFSDRLVDSKLNNLNGFRLPVGFGFSHLLTFLKPIEAISALSLICAIRLFGNISKFSLKTNSMPFVPLHFEFIRREMILGVQKHRSLFQKLILHGYLVSDNHYIVGQKSTGYKLGPKFDGAKWKVVDFGSYIEENLKDKMPKGVRGLLWKNLWNKFINATYSWKDMKEGKLKDVCRIMEENGKKLTFADEENLEVAVEKAAENTFAEYVAELAKKKKNPFWTQEQIRESYLFAIEVIKTGNFSVKCHDSSRINFTNRVFSNVTNLKKDFRKFLRYEGRPLTNLDIKSSQPALLSTFYTDSPEDQAEKAKYVDIIVNKDIYEILADNKMPRAKAKTNMFTVMFGKNHQCRGKFFDRFNSLFPILAQRIRENKKDNYKDVARKMQLMESKAIVEGAAHELLTAGVVVFTIHDSMMGLEEDLPLIKATMEKHLMEVLGFVPEVRVD